MHMQSKLGQNVSDFAFIFFVYKQFDGKIKPKIRISSARIASKFKMLFFDRCFVEIIRNFIEFWCSHLIRHIGIYLFNLIFNI